MKIGRVEIEVDLSISGTSPPRKHAPKTTRAVGKKNEHQCNQDSILLTHYYGPVASPSIFQTSPSLASPIQRVFLPSAQP